MEGIRGVGVKGEEIKKIRGKGEGDEAERVDQEDSVGPCMMLSP